MALLMSLAAVAWADEPAGEPKPGDQRPSPRRVSLDGVYVTIGPVGALTRIQDNWFAAVGAEISVVSVAERKVPALLGLDVGGESYAGRDGGRLWGEVQVGFERPLPSLVKLGLSAGVAAEIDPVRPPRWGAQGTLWLFAGVIPYVRAGFVEESGSFVEVGVMIKIPVRFRY